MPIDPIGGGAEEVRGTLIRSHQHELLAQAAVEREARRAQCREARPAGVRRRLRLALVRVGQALAGEAPAHPAQAHLVRPT